MSRSESLLLIVFMIVPALSGCEKLVIESEPRKFEEPLTEDELNRFLSIVRHLPGKKLPPLPAAALAAPAWSAQRTLPVNELLQEQLKHLDERYALERVLQRLRTLRGLDRALKREGWSVERFASVVVAFMGAINRLSLADETILATVLERGRQPMAALESDTRVFSTLSDDVAFVVLDRAVWVPLVHRAKWLSLVPPESIALVRAQKEVLEPLFGADLLVDPFASFSRIFHDAGMPFEELAETGSDDHLAPR